MKNYPYIEFTTFFDKKRKDALVEIRKAFIDTLELFLDDPNNQFLCNHALREKFAGYRNIDVTDDWMAIFKETLLGKQKVITFHILGTHKELYA